MIHQDERRSASDGGKRPVFYRSLANFLALSLFSNLLPIAAPPQVLGGKVGQPQRSAQETTTLQDSALDEKDVHPLEQEHPVKRELSGAQRHNYRLRLSANQFMKAIIEQRGIDVVAQISGPDGAQILEFDSERRPHGQEHVSLVTEAEGDYRLVVQPKQKGAAAGSYEIRIEELRAATDNDRALHEAYKLCYESFRLYGAGKYDESLKSAQRALEIRERLLGPDHRDTAATLNILATLYHSKGDYSKAESLYERTLLIREKTLGPDHPQFGDTLNNLAILYRSKGDYVKAESLFQRVLLITEKALGPDHPDVASSLNSLAILYYEKGDYAKAEPLYRRALDAWERALGPDSPHVASALTNLANLYVEIKGDYAKAEPLYLRTLTIREKTLAPDHPQVANSVLNLAVFYANKGDYAKAETFHRRALNIWEKALGPDHADVAFSLNNLAILYRDKGDYVKAEPLFERALLIREKALGPDHADVAYTLNGLAVLYRSKGDYVKAESLFQRALLITEKALGPDHSDFASSLNNLANLYYEKGDYAKAEPLYRRALNIWEKALGPDSPQVASAHTNLANLYTIKGDHAKAESLFERALAINEKVLGPDHKDVAEIFDNLARLHAAKGDFAQAVKVQLHANSVSERVLALNLATGSERQKLAYLALFSKQTDFTLWLHSQAAPNDPQALGLAFTTLLRRKGRGLDAMVDTIGALRRHATPQDRDLFGQLAEARAQLAALILRESGSAKPETYRTRIEPIEERVENLEAELSARSAEFRAQTQPVTLSAVQSAIPADSVLIEFVTYTPREPRTRESQPPRYLAYLLASQGQPKWPKWVDLGAAAPIERAVGAWRQSLRENGVDVKQLGRAVDELVMRPVRSLLQSESGQIRRLLIAPDGSLNLIPFPALVDEENRYLIERYTISYLTSGRDLLRLHNPQPSKSSPLVLADPLFGRMARAATRGPRNSVNSASAAGAGDQGEARSDPARVFFPQLPGTRGEALAIKAVLPEASLLLQERATEAALKRARAPRILHIATHGFFYGDQEGGDQEERRTETRNIPGNDPLRPFDLRRGRGAAQIENPLLRSGLILSGANLGKSGDDDGFLTALEVAGLDLWGTKLVTLSACDTGLGEIKNGEGVQGLRRALVLAGSESQVMSLWAVPDELAKDVIIPYYKALRRGEGRGAGLRQVQLRMLRSRDRRHPFYWAAFIQSGEWGNLDGRR